MNQLKLSEHFSIAEAIASAKATELKILNTPSAQDLEVMRITAAYMEVVRAVLNAPIKVNSWYRSPRVNAAVGSAETSQHRKGEAVDFVCSGFGTPLQIIKQLLAAAPFIPFDQLIYEHTWVHISFSILECRPKKQVLTLIKTASGNRYASGITDTKGNPL